jgi:acetyltransferase-like isoleucine patch superfamily enzyme
VLRIGSGVFIGHGSSFVVGQRIEVGNYVAIGGGSSISDTDSHSHERMDTPIWRDPPGEDNLAPVIIEDNVHLGRRCVVLKGVRIGARAIVGAGAVVRRDVPPDAIVAGNPARVAGWRSREAQEAHAASVRSRARRGERAPEPPEAATAGTANAPAPSEAPAKPTTPSKAEPVS